VAPPRRDAVLSATVEKASTQRDRHIRAIAETGRVAWQRSSGYNQRAKVEGQIGRWKPVLYPQPSSITSPPIYAPTPSLTRCGGVHPITPAMKRVLAPGYWPDQATPAEDYLTVETAMILAC